MRVSRPVVWCSMLAVAACGGRLVKYEDGSDEPGGSSNQGGSRSGSGASANQGATSSTGARPSQGGTSSSAGAVSIGGAVSTAGTTAAGGGCSCLDFDCGPGTVPVANPNGCCFHCEPVTCPDIPCPAIACGSGSHLEHRPGECCPTCVADSCERQQDAYRQFRAQLIERYSTLGCTTANDCTTYYEKNQCGYGCGIPIPFAAIANLDSNLQSYAQTTCSPDCPLTMLPCGEAGAPSGGDPACFQGRCE